MIEALKLEIKLLDFLKREVFAPEVDVNPETDLVAAGFDAAIVADVARKVDLNEYKRKQAAPGLKITPLAFGVGRRIPIVQKYVS